MDRNKLWIIGSAIVMVAIVALGWVVAIQPQLDAAATADAQRASVDETNQTNRIALVKLQADYKKLPELKSSLAALNTSVPTGTEIPAFVNELNALAGAHGVTVTGITFTDAEAYKPVDAPPAPGAGATDASSTATPTPTPTPSPTTAPAPAAPTAGMPPVTSPLITATNFAAVPASVSVTGPYSNVLDFVNGVQHGDRLFLVTNINTSQSSTGTDVDAKISGLIYALVQPTAATATK